MKRSHADNFEQAQNSDYPTYFGLHDKNIIPYSTKTSQFKPQNFEENCFREYFTAKKRKSFASNKTITVNLESRFNSSNTKVKQYKLNSVDRQSVNSEEFENYSKRHAVSVIRASFDSTNDQNQWEDAFATVNHNPDDAW